MKISSARRMNKARNQHLPEEVIEDILVKLPVKSIIRFQSVSKSWFDLIKSSRFMHKHFIESEENFLATCLDLPKRHRWESRFSAVSVYDEGFHEGVINICDSKRQRHLRKRRSLRLAGLNSEHPFSDNYLLPLNGDPHWHVVGNYKGVMCLTDYKKIMLVNPSLREVKTLPNPITPADGNGDPAEDDCSCESVGFGFDKKTMDLKVVRVISYYWDEVVFRQGFEVYDFRANGWRKLNCSYLPGNFDSLKCSTFFNGVIHWCATAQVFGWGILTFDVAKEFFNIIEYPQEVRESSEENPRFCLFVLDQESLAFLSCSPPFTSSTSFVNVWIMKEHANKEITWTKLYSIGPLTGFKNPICFWKKDKFLYITTTGKLISYDLPNHNSSHVVCDDASHLRSFYDVSTKVCMELGICRSSLFSINI